MENQLAAQKADHQRYVRENEELTRRLKKFVERLDNDKSDLFQQLLEEKRSVTDRHRHWFNGDLQVASLFININARKSFFTNRIVEVWNSLPSAVVFSNNVYTFKRRLTEFNFYRFLHYT